MEQNESMSEQARVLRAQASFDSHERNRELFAAAIYAIERIERGHWFEFAEDAAIIGQQLVAWLKEKEADEFEQANQEWRALRLALHKMDRLNRR